MILIVYVISILKTGCKDRVFFLINDCLIFLFSVLSCYTDYLVIVYFLDGGV
jgi:hypothetical protein